MEKRRPNYHHNARVLAELEVGDLVEFPRGIYSHWGVYIGKGKIVHLAGEYDDGINGEIKTEHAFTICGVQFDKAKVCIDDFWDIVEDSKARKNNSGDSKWSPLDAAEIVKNAVKKLGSVGYNLIYSNCEHFAKWCRYGKSKSEQVDNFMTGAAVGIGAALAIGVIYACAKYFKSDEKEKQEKKLKHKK